jgi:hypothetical protein
VAGSSSWPTPTASDAGYLPDLIIGSGAVQPVSPADVSEGSGGQFALNNACRVWTVVWLILRATGWRAATIGSPSSLPVRVSLRFGKGSSLSDLVPNPRFYEMMMGWPIGWTDAAAPATAWSAWLRRSRGQLSRLISTFEAEPE